MFDCMPHEPGKLMVQRDSTSCGLLEALPFSNALSTAEWNVSQGQVPPCHHAIPPSPPLPLAGPSSAAPPGRPAGREGRPGRPGQAYSARGTRPSVRRACLRPRYGMHISKEGKRGRGSGERRMAVPLFKHLPS